jgi:hypothetical protein
MFAIKTKVATSMYKKFVFNESTALLVRLCFLSGKGKTEKRNPQWRRKKKSIIQNGEGLYHKEMPHSPPYRGVGTKGKGYRFRKRSKLS